VGGFFLDASTLPSSGRALKVDATERGAANVYGDCIGEDWDFGGIGDFVFAMEEEIFVIGAGAGGAQRVRWVGAEQ
jgi:hypothetical protein